MAAIQEKRTSPGSGMKALVTILIALILAGAVLFLAAGGAASMAARPGFFGSNATLSSDVNLIAQLLLLLGLSLGAALAHRGHISTHQYLQTGLVLFNIVLTAFIMIASFESHVAPKLPGILGSAYGLVAAFHAALGTIAILCGVYLILRMNQLIPKSLQVSGWRNLMRFTLGLYWAVGLFGLTTYLIWYVI